MVENQGSDSGSLKLTKTELLPASEQDRAQQSALSSLLHEAYEHPVGTGIGVAAVLGTAAALTYASRGRNLNVLIIEDTPMMGMALKDAVVASGHKATWVNTVSKLNPLTGVDQAGKEVALSGKRFHLALVDGDLGKGQLTGPEIVPFLKQQNITSIGTSTIASFNKDMLANGAQIAAGKPVIYTSLFGKTFDLKTAVRNPASVQESLVSAGVPFFFKQWGGVHKQWQPIS